MGKLDMVLSRTDLPETVEALIESFMFGARYKAFFEKYGPLNARFLGPGFIAGWHPKVASDTRARWLWNLFAKEPDGETSFSDSDEDFEADMVAPEPDLRQLKALEGKRVMITYRNGQGRVMRYIKLVMYASDRALHVREDEADPHGFSLNHERIQRLDLFVDLPHACRRDPPRIAE